MQPGMGSMPTSDTTECPENTSDFWPATVFEVPVALGDCVHMAADNAGSQGADLFGAIVEPSGKSTLLDEEVACTAANPDGYMCPEGSAVTEAAGSAYVMVGAWEGSGCTAGEDVPFQVTVAVNGTDVTLDSAVCAGDLLEIIP